MLVEVKLRCFRQHVNRTFNFTEGLNLLRAANEGGKSTILEAINYALGGSRALSESVGDVVTWGHSESEMSVKVTLRVVGVDYVFERSPKGATITSSCLDKKVTGQTEVSSFASDLLGGSAKTLSLLLLASQNGLQDVIDAGPGEVSGLVAKLGNLEVVDAVLAQAESDLVLGSEKVGQDRITTLISMEEQLLGSGPQPGELEALQTGLDRLKEEAEAARSCLESVWHPASDIASQAVNDAQQQMDAVTLAKSKLVGMSAEITTVKASKDQAASVSKPSEETLTAIKAELITAGNMDKIAAVFADYEALNATKPANVWVADTEANAAVEVNREITRLGAELDAQKAKLNDDYMAVDLAAAERAVAVAYDMKNPNLDAAAAKTAEANEPYLTSEIDELNREMQDVVGKSALARRDANKVINEDGLKCHACGRDFDNAEQRREHIAREKEDVQSAKALLTSLDSRVAEITAQLADINRRVKERKQQLLSEANTLTVEGDSARNDLVKRAKDALQDVRAKIEGYRLKASFGVRNLTADIKPLLELLEVGGKFSTFAGLHRGSGLIETDYREYPPKITWVGPQGRGHTRPMADVQKDITAWESHRLAWERAQGVVETLEASIIALEAKYAAYRAEVEAMPVPDMVAVKAHHQEVLERTNEAQVNSARAATLVADAESKVSAWKLKSASHEAELKALQQRLEDARSQLSELQKNNAFVKEVKKLKPLITEHMWSKALAAISNYFSDLRGQQVVVTRDGGSFKFNGKPASSLSGSGKDILAIAIRAALGRVFLPHIGMIVLDEPAHGSDEDRTARILGFLSKCGYEQIVLASHDPLSESVADNIIYVQEAQ